VGLLGVQGLHGRPPASAATSVSLPRLTPPSPLPPSSLPLVHGCVNGDRIPEAARVGSVGWRGSALVITAGGGGRVESADARTGAWLHRDDAPSLARRLSVRRRH
jgi:hypothetical protein